LAYRLRRHDRGPVEPRKEQVRCTHYYHYLRHEELGLCYVRIPSWFPFAVRGGRNGRRWLARQLDNRGVGYRGRDNLVRAVDDVALAQRLLDEQVRVAWPQLLADLVRALHPLWDCLHQGARAPFYGRAEQSAWATAYVFRDPADLAAWYPRWLRHGIENLSCTDVLRYLGKQVPAQGYGSCTGEAKVDLRPRPDGTRLQFWYNGNAVKCYDKDRQALRIETTLNDPSAFAVYRAKVGEGPEAPKSWQQMRKGVADLARRAEVSAAANRRLAESLATVAEPTTRGELLAPLGRPVVVGGRRVARALNPVTGRTAGCCACWPGGLPGQRLPQPGRAGGAVRGRGGGGRAAAAGGPGDAAAGAAAGARADPAGAEDAPLPADGTRAARLHGAARCPRHQRRAPYRSGLRNPRKARRLPRDSCAASLRAE
jgi:hypothetical protein